MSITVISDKIYAGSWKFCYRKMNKEGAFTLAELDAMVSHVNTVLRHDSDLDCLPIKPAYRLYQEQRNGVLFCKLINRIRRGTISHCKINKAVDNVHDALENQKLVIEGAKNIGCRVKNITAEDLWCGKESHVLQILWEIVKTDLLSDVNVEKQPNLAVLRMTGEGWTDFAKLPPEEYLKRWVNYHVRHTNYRRLEMTDFDSSLKDSEIYFHLLHQLAPDRCSLSPLREQDLFVRAKKLLDMAQVIRCRKYLTAHEIVKGNPRLNLAFLANLFHMSPGLQFPFHDMDTIRLREELNTALSRCCHAEEERSLLTQMRREMSEELTDTRQKLEESLRELEILKRKALRFEDENKQLVGMEEMLSLLKAENCGLKSQIQDIKAVEEDSQATIKNQEIIINSLKTEKEILKKEYENKLSELENKFSAISRKQTTMVLQKEAITHERDLLKRKHDKCEAELKRLKPQIDRRQRHVQQLRQLYKSFILDKNLAEALYGKLDVISLQGANGKNKPLKFCADGGPSSEDTSSRVFLLKDNFLFVFNNEKEDQPKDVFRLDQASIQKEDCRTLQIKITPKEVCYFIKVSSASKLKDLEQELEVAADWWTERQRTSPGSRFRDTVRANMLTSSIHKRKLNFNLSTVVATDI